MFVLHRWQLILFVCSLVNIICIISIPMENAKDDNEAALNISDLAMIDENGNEIAFKYKNNENNKIDDDKTEINTMNPLSESIKTTTTDFISGLLIEIIDDNFTSTTEMPYKNDYDPFKCDPITEVYTECTNTCPATCEEPDRKPCNHFCAVGCECAPGYIKDWRWKCIPKESCPKCGENENFQNCGSCEPTCDDYQNFPACYGCKRGCYCNYGFVRDMSKNGTCVPIEQCVNKCGPNEYWDVNGEPCVRTPENPRPKCLFEKAEPSCQCNTGFRRDPKTNECLPVSIKEFKCSANETYLFCGSDCATNCHDTLPRYKCATICNRGCFCKDGYRRQTSTNRCISPEECSKYESDAWL